MCVVHCTLLCLWFLASLIYINNCPTRWNTKQSSYYSASSLYMFRVSTTPIIRSTQNCNYSLRYWSYFLFIVPYGCVCSIQFPFDFFKSENLFCLFGVDEFYVYVSMYHWSILITVQRDATQSSLFIILQVLSTCSVAWPRKEVASQKIRPVPEAVVTVLCTPDDGCGWHPKHVEWTCRMINRLLCVASSWTIINIVSLYT